MPLLFRSAGSQPADQLFSNNSLQPNFVCEGGGVGKRTFTGFRLSADDGHSHLGGHTGSKEAEGIKEKDENGAERRPKNAPADVHRKTASKWTRTRVLVGRAEPGENSLLFGKRFIPK